MVKTITVTDEAYEKLKSMKREDESFTDVIKRIEKPKRPLRDFLGAWGEGDSRELQKKMKEIRERASKSARDRSERLRQQRYG